MDDVRLLAFKLRRLLRSRGRSADDTDDLIQEAFLRLQIYCRDKSIEEPHALVQLGSSAQAVPSVRAPLVPRAVNPQGQVPESASRVPSDT
jgi:hypothetical protein